MNENTPLVIDFYGIIPVLNGPYSPLSIKMWYEHVPHIQAGGGGLLCAFRIQIENFNSI
jgi:hypothetical protein